MFDYQVRLVNFPSGKVREAITKNEDSSYTIFIDANLSRDRQKERFLHAIGHILSDDFGGTDADMVERIAHGNE